MQNEGIIKERIKLTYLDLVTIVLIVFGIAFASCTTTESNAPVPVQTTVSSVPPVVTQTFEPPAQPTVPPPAAPTEQTPATGLASAIAAQIPGKVAQQAQSIQISVANEEINPTAVGQSIPDLPFTQLHAMSSPQIIAKTDVLILSLAASSYPGRVLYSPVTMNLAADDLGFTAGQYLDKINTIKAENSSQEQVRLVYVKYLQIVKLSAYATRDAAIAESEGNYQQAAANVKVALIYLNDIKQLPNQNPKSPLKQMRAYLQ